MTSDSNNAGREATCAHVLLSDERCDVCGEFVASGREATADKWQAGLDGLHTNDCWDDDHSGCREIVDAVIDGIENAGFKIVVHPRHSAPCCVERPL